MAAEESARFVRRAGATINRDMLEQLSADVRWLASLYLRRPPYAVFRPLATLRRDIFNMIDGHPRPNQLVELYRLAGQLSVLLAHASSDLGQQYAAETHVRTAWLCAENSSDDGIRAYARWVQSNVSYWRGDYRDAAELAASAQQFASGSSDMLRLTSQEARAWAAIGDAQATETALSEAANLRERGADSPLPGVFEFSAGKAAYYSSEVRLMLGGHTNAQGAMRDAEEAISLLASPPEIERSPELSAAAQLDLVAAYLALGDLEGAGHHIRPILSLPSQSRTVPIVGRVNEIDHTLTSELIGTARLAVEMREEIELFQAYPAARELPAITQDTED